MTKCNTNIIMFSPLLWQPLHIHFVPQNPYNSYCTPHTLYHVETVYVNLLMDFNISVYHFTWPCMLFTVETQQLCTPTYQCHHTRPQPCDPSCTLLHCHPSWCVRHRYRKCLLWLTQTEPLYIVKPWSSWGLLGILAHLMRKVIVVAWNLLPWSLWRPVTSFGSLPMKTPGYSCTVRERSLSCVYSQADWLAGALTAVTFGIHVCMI